MRPVIPRLTTLKINLKLLHGDQLASIVDHFPEVATSVLGIVCRQVLAMPGTLVQRADEWAPLVVRSHPADATSRFSALSAYEHRDHERCHDHEYRGHQHRPEPPSAFRLPDRPRGA